MSISLIDRYLGSFLGLAIGDALGAPIEFKKPGTFTPIIKMENGGHFNLSKGQWTDDTSMALCIAASLIENRRFETIDILNRFVRWYRQGYMSSSKDCFDIGTRTRKALEDFEKNQKAERDPALISFPSNGSIMRLAPIPLAFRKHKNLAMQLCGESSALTHNHIDCFNCCRYLGILIISALEGYSKEEILSPHFSPVKNMVKNTQINKNIKTLAEGSFKYKEPPNIEAGSSAIKCLEAALWAFYKTDNFKDGCLLAVNLGNDSDTTAAVYGQLAGAYYGINSIPIDWTEDLRMKSILIFNAITIYFLSESIN